MASTAANIIRTSCATNSASSPRTPKSSAASVRDNLMLGAAQADDQQLVEAVIRSGADIFLSRDAAGFDLPVGERGSRLSGGQRSLLVLARALVSPSKLLFLDEPTGAMDTQTENYFIDRLKKALAPNQTLMVATHRHQMLSIVDRLIVIDGGPDRRRRAARGNPRPARHSREGRTSNDPAHRQSGPQRSRSRRRSRSRQWRPIVGLAQPRRAAPARARSRPPRRPSCWPRRAAKRSMKSGHWARTPS